ncbi:MAG: tRNA (adenosine(37)-N6)-dimethylallyltransferase MiaA [Planctomycetes bacterium]|nr:tRNA (adenosine(37)-N6)-dimethylallyltransferase MiaA [Planctomycetota bacterium]
MEARLFGPDAPLVFLLGQTASGKGAAARALAARVPLEVLSVDSMKVYRGMDVGTAKPTPEERRSVPHHLIDVAEPWERWNVARFVSEAGRARAAVAARGRLPLLVGGTGLYVRALMVGIFEGPPVDAAVRGALEARVAAGELSALHAELAACDPATAARLHPNDAKRIVRALEVWRATGRALSSFQVQPAAPRAGSVLLVGLRWTPDSLDRRIHERVERMFTQGLVEEVRGLLADPRGLGREAAQALGYREVVEHLHGVRPLPETVALVAQRTRRFARRQMTWFRSFPDVHWLDLSSGDTAASVAARIEAVLAAPNS